VTRSYYLCTLEDKHLRLGLNYVRGVRADAAKKVVSERANGAFRDIDDLARRVPELRKDEMARLAEVGALNPLESQQQRHRRDALWKATRAGRVVGPLLDEVPETEIASPLERMTTPERLHADYAGTGLTIGRHPMAYYRSQMRGLGVTSAADLAYAPSGGWVRVAGCVIVRQRPGTAKGILFLSLEDETGIANAVVSKELFADNRLVVLGSPWLLVEGPVQNVDSVIHIRAKKIRKLDFDPIATASHDFH
jgi:error-prone DNA polymerase